jgi:dihydroorotate dehydrogenase
MYRLLRPLLFSMPPEQAHHFTVAVFKSLMRVPGAPAIARLLFSVNDRGLEREVFGLRFPNPVGLAAGFDKDAGFFGEFANLGFGFIEVGTITPMPQDGNPRPRMFRLPMDSGLINRMGFNNSGVEVARERLLRRRPGLIIGGNIGKNKVTPNEQAVDDYLLCFRRLHDVVDYFVVNVSSPNTPGLRELQDKGPLMHILNTLMAENSTVPRPRPILLKIAPDLTDAQLDDIIDIVRETGIAGIIATNTTISREGLNTPKPELEAIGMGGLSGKPVRERSTEVIRYLHTKSNGAFPIIGVGGIGSAADALGKLQAGATLVQVYTGFIYRGPSLIKEINRGILAE